MFTLHSGPFHPYLESRLVEVVQRIKSADARTPIAIVVPSESLRRRLQWLLSVKHGCVLFDVHYLTFHQFALRLDAERSVTGQGDMVGSPVELVDDIFFDYAVSHLLQEDPVASNPFASRAGSLGMCQALWRTIRDLQEAQVEPHVALRGLQEGLFDEAAYERLEGVFHLHERLQAWSRQLAVGLPDDLAHAVIPWIPYSPYLARLSEILYYGFYDITQVQLTLLEEVARHSTVSVFFPLGEGEAFQFAQRFFDRHLLKAGVVHQSVAADKEMESESHVERWTPQEQIVNAVGVEGELTYICKAIVQHREQVGYTWHEIGVVARSVEPYSTDLSRIFKAHHIPYWTTATRPLLEEPLAKVWWILAGLREDRFRWRQVLDVLTSPWFPGRSKAGRSFQECSHVWVQAVHYFRLVRGDEDWDRLASVAADPAAVQEWQEHCDLSVEEASDSLQVFAEAVTELLFDCHALPVSGSVGELTEAYEIFVKKYAWFSENSSSSTDAGILDERNVCLQDRFEQVLASVRQLDQLGRQVTWEEWANVFRAALEKAVLPLSGQAEMGVQVLDVMAARGRSFKALFIVGMNDHVFPRIVREDAFLRDRDRKVLAESLGYKIDEKLKGFDEEQLLFALLQQSAQEYLYLVYQRADQDGRPLIPSSLLRGYLHGMDLPRFDVEQSLPSSLSERARVGLWPSQSETAQESRVRGVLEGHTFQPKAPEGSPWWSIFHEGMGVIPHLERSRGKAGPYDGIIDDSQEYWPDLIARGLSPTALGTYAQCPMRYWMKQVLQVGELQDCLSTELPSRVWGELVHQVLCDVYQALLKEGWPQQLISSEKIEALLAKQMSQVCEAHARKFGRGYRLIWDWMNVRLTRMMLAMIEYDQREHIEHGLVSHSFEVEAAGELSDDVETPHELLRIRGRFDRVDTAQGHSGIRIVDYKVSMRRTFQDDELDLVTKALQGRQLQPPLYSLMRPLPKEENSAHDESGRVPIQSVEFRYLRPMQEESVRSASFSGAVWNTSTGAQLSNTLWAWVQGIRTGQFFMMPGPHCQNCQYASACRFQHHPSWSRAYGLPLARAYRTLRRQKASHV